MGALTAQGASDPAGAALAALVAAAALRDDGSRIPLRWCRRLHAQRIGDGFSSGLQAVAPDWIRPADRQALVEALLAADADTAAAGRLGAALLHQDGRAALRYDPDGAAPTPVIPGYVRAALAALADTDSVGLGDPRLSAHERLDLASRLRLSRLSPAPQPGPGHQRLLYVRTQGHILLLDHRPDSALPRLLGLHR